MSDDVERGHSELASIVAALRTVSESSPDSVFVLDTDGRFLMVNPTLCALLGIDESAVLGQHFERPGRSTDGEQVRDAVAEALAGEPQRYRASWTTLRGDLIVSEITLLPLRRGDRVVAVHGTGRNLTAESSELADRQRSEELLRIAGRVARFGGWHLDGETRRVTLSEGARRILELPDDVDDVVVREWALDAIDNLTSMGERVETCLRDGTPFDVESTMKTGSGRTITVRTIGQAERRADGQITGVYGAIWDVTESAEARRRERALESRLTATVSSISDGFFFVDHDDRMTYLNPAAIEMSRRTLPELLGEQLWTLFPEAVEAGFREAFNRARVTGERVVYRAHFAPYDRWFETTAYGATEGLAVYLRDVTDEHAAQEAARHDHERLAYQAALLDTARDAMLVRKLDGTILYWNKAAAELYGCPVDEAIGSNVFDIIRTEPVSRDAALEEVMRTGFFAGELQQTGRHGRPLIVDCRWQLLRDEDGVPTGLFAVNSDITDYRREQETRQRAQRLESLGTLAGGIAHDLNNVLTPILMSVQLLAQDEDDADRRALLSTMEAAVKRGSEMIRQVLTFARGVDGRRTTVDIGVLLDDLQALARDLVPHGITVQVERRADLPSTVGDPTQLLQVLVNLVTNARDAVGEDGRISLTATPLEIADEYTSVSHTVAPGAYVQIAVEDSGQGMPTTVAEKIFEPFFTTKPHGKGTGLGLATSLSIVRSHGGFMQVYSEEGRGTRFIVGLPVATRPESSNDAVAANADLLPRGNGETILVIDDEESIRTVTRRTLEAYGYRVVTAADGREGIDLVERAQHPFDLVLTDMMMPVMDGAATSAYLEEHYPDLPIIAASGLSAGGDSTSVGMGIARFLAKPYTTRTLVTSVSDTLREHRSSTQQPTSSPSEEAR